MSDLLKSINFIKKISISINDVTTSDEANDGYKVVIANYKFESKSFNTKRLFYRNIEKQDYIKNKNKLQTYYNEPVFWLDIEKHDWPHGRGAEIEKTIIDDMIDGEDSEFRNFLLSLANNQKTGHLQILTKKGKPQQYGFNFENNNHWHDIIFLLQKIISNKGEIPLQDEFINLVFNWGNTEPRERVRLKPNHKFILNFSKLIKEYQPKLQATSMINILNYKKQIILQGPPGTGKTRLAKQLATEMINTELTVEIIQEELKVNQKIANHRGTTDYYTISAINEDSVSLKSENASKNWSPKYTNIIETFNRLKEGENVENKNGLQPYEIAIAQYFTKHKSWISKSSQFKLIQFHPSYTYEDFVRGIEAQSNGETIEYKNINKTLGTFANEALKNYKLSRTNNKESKIDNWVEEKFEEFKSEIEAQLIDNEMKLSGEISIFEVADNSFKYGRNWKMPSHIKFDEFRNLIKSIIQSKLILSNQQIPKEFSVHAHYRYTYYNALLEKFFQQFQFSEDQKGRDEEKEKNYVLVIDEINRANLSAVLGELIYALEYRGEAVESIYDVNGKELILPPNLYIIGTMNTADRSVGHIDYAIRRRFAFDTILPKDLRPELGEDFQWNLFLEVSKLFVKNVEEYLSNQEVDLQRSEFLSEEFNPEDIWLGHSYFIQQYELDEFGNEDRDQPIDFNLRLQYEIKPILHEYVNDGILKEKAKEIILNLNTDDK